MHPTRHEIEQTLLDLADKDVRHRVSEHLRECRLCQEIARDFEAFQAEVEKTSAEDRQAAGSTRERLYDEARRGQVIQLTLLPQAGEPEEMYMAADGQTRPAPDIVEKATLVSDSSDLVLRLMRDNKAAHDFLQLVAENRDEIAHTLIQAPSLKQEFVTDARGRVELPPSDETPWTDTEWQIKMPDAVFDLKPLEFDPNLPEYAESVELNTDRSDRMRVTFEGRYNHFTVSIEVLELQGQTDLGAMRVIVAAGTTSQSEPTAAGHPIALTIPGSKTPITIRLYRTS